MQNREKHSDSKKKCWRKSRWNLLRQQLCLPTLYQCLWVTPPTSTQAQSPAQPLTVPYCSWTHHHEPKPLLVQLHINRIQSVHVFHYGQLGLPIHIQHHFFQLTRKQDQWDTFWEKKNKQTDDILVKCRKNDFFHCLNKFIKNWLLLILF